MNLPGKTLALHGDEWQPGANENNSFLGFEEAPPFGRGVLLRFAKIF